ncbi:hypothetical protein niasHT_002857 [Heterodera trifolii]|uniref:BTB domain-containing protein n=1 Tax=Heterodera trifolii TaxID=157864 RepID=A0ABD2LQL8_9BILA
MPSNSDDKQAPGGQSSSMKGWLMSRIAGKSKEKSSAANSSSTNEADLKKSSAPSSSSTNEADLKKSSAPSSSSTNKADPKKCDLTSRMDSLFCSSEDADMYFLVKEEQTGEEQLIPAHKPNLLAASKFFEKMFEFNEQNKQNKTWTADNPFVVTDISIRTFLIMLRFIYTDNFSEVNANNLLSVLHAADQYEVSALIDECVAFPISKMENVFLALAEAHQYIGVQAFADRCFDYIDKNALFLLQSNAFLEIDQPMLCQILQRDQLQTHDEIEIWNAALRWADNQCRENGKEITGENRREMLGPALYKIRVQTIPHKYFTRNIVSTGVLTNAEVISVFLFHSLLGKNLPENPYKMPFSAAPCGNNKNNNASGRCWKRSGKITFTNDKLREFSRKHNREFFSDAIDIMGIQCKSKVKFDNKITFYLTCEPKAGRHDRTWSFTCSTGIRRIYSFRSVEQKIELKKCGFNDKATEYYYFSLYEYEIENRNMSIEITVEDGEVGDVGGFGV